MTKSELRQLIESIVDEKLKNILDRQVKESVVAALSGIMLESVKSMPVQQKVAPVKASAKPTLTNMSDVASQKNRIREEFFKQQTMPVGNIGIQNILENTLPFSENELTEEHNPDFINNSNAMDALLNRDYTKIMKKL